MAVRDYSQFQSHNSCTKCGAFTVRTADSRIYNEGVGRKRRKHCDTCGHRWTTVEVPVEVLENIHNIMTALNTMTKNVDELNTLLEQTRHLVMMEEGKTHSIIPREYATRKDTHDA